VYRLWRRRLGCSSGVLGFQPGDRAFQLMNSSNQLRQFAVSDLVSRCGLEPALQLGKTLRVREPADHHDHRRCRQH